MSKSAMKCIFMKKNIDYNIKYMVKFRWKYYEVFKEDGTKDE